MSMRLLCLALCLAFAAAQTCPINNGCDLVWSDEFSGTSLDPKKWEAQIGRGCELPSGCGWGNGELQYYQAQNAEVSGGTLKIWARAENVGGAPFTSARLRTKGRFAKTYGIFEARIKLPAFDGAWPAFWMMPETDTYGGWAASGEIDIMEAKNQCDAAQHTLHFGGSWPNQRNSDQCQAPCITTITPGWHTYRLVWRAKAMRFFIDGVQTCIRSDWWTNSDPQNDDAPFDKPFHLLLNMALGGAYAGKNPSPASLPQAMEVDYVRVYNLK